MSLLDLEQREGRCAFCDDPLPPPKTKPSTVCCGGRECARAYNTTYKAQRGRVDRCLRVVRQVRQMSDGTWMQQLSCRHWVPCRRKFSEHLRPRRHCHTCLEARPKQ
jgi:hypothetical protein